MDYSQTEKDLKKITDIAEKLPDPYRYDSFKALLKLYGIEKSIAMELEMRKKQSAG